MSLIASRLEVVPTQVSLESDKPLINQLLKSSIGDHVDILGRSSLNDLILRVAGGKGHLIENTVVSDILKYADKVKIQDD